MLSRLTRWDAQSWANQRAGLLPFVLILVLGLTVVQLLPLDPAASRGALQVGDIAPQDIVAQREISFVSEIETARALNAAETGVRDIFDPPDPRISRQQVRLAAQVMAYVDEVRADPFAGEDRKQVYLAMITALDLDEALQLLLIRLPQSQFDLFEEQVIALVEDAMSGPIEADREGAVEAQLPLIVSPEFPEELIEPAVTVAQQFIVPNRAINLEATEGARADAMAEIEPVRRTYLPGEVVVSAGERVDALDLEALAALGWGREAFSWLSAAQSLLIALLAALVLSTHAFTSRVQRTAQAQRLIVIAILMVLYSLAARLMIDDSSVLVYLFPSSALALAAAALLNLPMAVLVTVTIAALSSLFAGGSIQPAILIGAGGVLAASSLDNSDDHLSAFFRAGLLSSLIGIAVILIFSLNQRTDAFELARNLGLTVLNGLFSASLALAILFVVGSVTRITTSVQLVDLLRPDHPLQRRLQQEALGTYHHTLAVANMVETACEAIGANSLLARAGALYHDIGKVMNPGFFIENRIDDLYSTYQGLSYEESARIIIEHVTDGVALARSSRLPPAIIDFICEHHGTRPVTVFLQLARERAQRRGEVLDEAPFFYPGPIPQSRETAILMLADSCESAARAERLTERAEIEKLVQNIIQDNLRLNQLENSGLTLTDLKVVKDTLVRTLQGMYHPRIKYPKLTGGANDAAEPVNADLPPSAGSASDTH